MFITKKHIGRRALLRGAGVALGLPLLVARIEFRCREEQALKSLLRRGAAASPGSRGEV